LELGAVATRERVVVPRPRRIVGMAKKRAREEDAVPSGVDLGEEDGSTCAGSELESVSSLDRFSKGRVEDEWHLESCQAVFKKISVTLNTLHEHVSPIFTLDQRRKMGIESEYGGITGTLRAQSFFRIAKVLCGVEEQDARLLSAASKEDTVRPVLSPKYRMVKNKSIFCDIGSGTGRPSLYMASLGLRASVGLDIDPMQVFSSCVGRRLVRKRIKALEEKATRTGFFHADVCRLNSLEPVTHVFGFLGYVDIVKRTTLLVALSETVQVFVAVVLHVKELDGTGILEESEETEEDKAAPVIRVHGLTMPSGRMYTGVVIPMTKSRRDRVIKTLAKEHKETLRLKAEGLSFAKHLHRALNAPDGFEDLASQHIDAFLGPQDENQGQRRRGTRLRRAASRR